MKKFFFLLSSFFFLLSFLHAIKPPKVDLRIAYAPVYNHLIEKKFKLALQVEVNYFWTRWLETGVYLGYGKTDDRGFSYRTIYPLGIDIKLHPIPLIIGKEMRIDPYLALEFGGMFLTGSLHHVSTFSYRGGMGVGLNLYVFNKVGFFAEYQWGTFFDQKNYFEAKNKFADPLLKGSKKISFPKIGISIKF